MTQDSSTDRGPRDHGSTNEPAEGIGDPPVTPGRALRDGGDLAGLFGSVARDEAGSDSDVDLLVERRRPTGLIQFFAIQHFLEEILGVHRVDLIERSALRPFLRDTVLKEAIDVS
jgi:hypothetical protein